MLGFNMRVLWSIQYRGGDPANCRRKVTRLLKIEARDEAAILPWVDNTHYVQFFSELEATSWEPAVVELLNTASRFSARWSMTTYPRHISATSNDRKIDHVETLAFELNENQEYRMQSGLILRSS